LRSFKDTFKNLSDNVNKLQITNNLE
jgi:hypothetical protein